LFYGCDNYILTVRKETRLAKSTRTRPEKHQSGLSPLTQFLSGEKDTVA